MGVALALAIMTVSAATRFPSNFPAAEATPEDRSGSPEPSNSPLPQEAFTLPPPVEQDAPALTDTFQVATYNVYYRANAETLDDVEALSQTADIIGLQEVLSHGAHDIAAALWDTHEPFLGRGRAGGYDGEFNPIFYDKTRFEAVHGETVQLHGADFNGPDTPARIANFVLLQEKATGATILAVNTHLANGADAGRVEGIRVIQEKIAELRNTLPIDSVVLLGDFNGASPTDPQYRAARVPEGQFTFEEGWNLDHIYIDDRAGGDSEYRVIDGGESDHNIVTRDVRVMYDPDPRKALLAPSNQGGILFEDVGYQGEKWIFGFGTTGPRDTGWNDRVSSLLLEDSTAVAAQVHSEYDARHDTAEDARTLFSESSGWVGDEWNDRISYLEWGLTAVSTWAEPK